MILKQTVNNFNQYFKSKINNTKENGFVLQILSLNFMSSLALINYGWIVVLFPDKSKKRSQSNSTKEKEIFVANFVLPESSHTGRVDL